MNGKNLKYFVLGAAIVAAGLGALAVNIPNSFTAGQVISAAGLNANFAAFKAAVDALETALPTKQNRVTGACAVGQTIRSINADGTVVCGGTRIRVILLNNGTIFGTTAAGVSATTRTSTGIYLITFSRNVDSPNCAYFTTSGTESSDPLIVEPTGGVRFTGGLNTQVRVNVRNNSGVSVNSSFSILVECDD